ncbi:MAG: ABC transporter ATP-binding protein [Chthonomonadales bacterium]
MAVATFSHVTVEYGRRVALDNLDLEIPEGSVGLLGPNGAGKTTAIKALMGFLRPASGSARVFGLDAARQAARIRTHTGLMPEADCYFPAMTAVGMVAYAAELAGLPPAQALRRAHETLEYCGLGDARYRMVEGFSTGMKQRVKLAQALVHGPKLLFLDEPTNGLDPAGREAMLALIRDLSYGKGINVVLSTHLLLDVERTCSYVIVLRDGRVAAAGALRDLMALGDAYVDVELRLAEDGFDAAVVRRGGGIVSRLGSRYRIRLPKGIADPARFLFECAEEGRAQVRGFRPAARSLEDVFVEAVE